MGTETFENLTRMMKSFKDYEIALRYWTRTSGLEMPRCSYFESFGFLRLSRVFPTFFDFVLRTKSIDVFSSLKLIFYRSFIIVSSWSFFAHKLSKTISIKIFVKIIDNSLQTKGIISVISNFMLQCWSANINSNESFV